MPKLEIAGQRVEGAAPADQDIGEQAFTGFYHPASEKAELERMASLEAMSVSKLLRLLVSTYIKSGGKLPGEF